MHIDVKRLDSGHWHVRGHGPCNWAQPPVWPCDEKTLRDNAFPEASDVFIMAALALAEEATRKKETAYFDGCAYCDREKANGETNFPPHDASSGCESGKRPHCTCDNCW